MWFFKICGVTRKDRRSNVDILKELSTERDIIIIIKKISATDNLLCRACTDNAVKEIASLSSVGS